MADNAPSVESAAAPSTRDEAPTNQRSAAPNKSATTGRSHMAEYGALQAAQGTIVNVENETEYPITVHYLNATHLLEMFRFIIGQLVFAFTRELGFPDPTSAQARPILLNITNSIAYAALLSAYAVCYNKARANDALTVTGLPLPSFASETFPVLITALINSLGPIQRGDYPSRRKHIPLLLMSDITAIRPNNIGAHLINLFKEKIQRTRILLANVELLGSKSAEWWLFFPMKVAVTAAVDVSSSTANQPLYTKRVFSPVRYEELENFLKLAIVFMPAPLVKPGCGSYSASPWYAEDEISRFAGNLPTRDNFPNEVLESPIFWKSCSAYYYEIEAKIVPLEVNSVNVPIDDSAGSSSTATGTVRSTRAVDRDSAPPSGSYRVTTKRIRSNTAGTAIPVSPTYRPRSPNLAVAEANDNNINMYRIVYYYFDHIAIDAAHPTDYVQWAYNLCQAI